MSKVKSMSMPFEIYPLTNNHKLFVTQLKKIHLIGKHKKILTLRHI